jgi:beta-1,4-mannooligosaccharide/beta-1,4-mannosyl-N-acetylglucosamine phosphorylase
MSNSSTIVGEALPNLPWQDRPAGRDRVVWRYEANPVIPRDRIPCANSIFNSAVVPFEGAFAGVFRVDDRARRMRLHAGRSRDGLAWEIDPEPIEFAGAEPEVAAGRYKYDPRVVPLEGRYYVTWCNDHHGPTIGIGWTEDFRTFHQTENAFLPANRNGVLFPRKIGRNYAMLSRPSDWGHTPFGDIFYSDSPDLTYWGHHRHVMGRASGWEALKIGPGPVPIETTEGWLLIYHGVLLSCNGYVYSFGAALLDLERPWKVRARCREYLLSPQRDYECVGDTPNVAFPCAALTDAPTGRIAIYYGGADTVTCLAFAHADELVEFVKQNSEG